MATIIAIRERTQSKTAMGKVIRYVAQDKKTLSQTDGRSYKLLSGKDCCAETAYSEFMATKRQYGKESGVYFYQYVQSFKPGEKTTPQEIHQMGLDLAEYFKGHEVLIATHIDADHWHSHLIVNSVSHETGLKLQFNADSLKQIRQLSDKICSAHGFDVLKPYEKQEKKALSQREYRAAVRGESWKFKLMGAIDKAMQQSRSKADFIDHMQRQGYEVKWEPQHKYITYTAPEGQKCRDIRLHEDKYLKANMEGYYAEYGRTQAYQHGAGHAVGAVYADSLRDTQGSMGGHAGAPIGHGKGVVGAESLLGAIPQREAARHVQHAARGLEEDLPFGAAGHEGYDYESVSGDERYDEELDWDDDGYDDFENGADFEEHGGYAPASGYVAGEAQSKVAGAGGVDLNDILYLAKAVEDLVNPYNPEEEKTTEAEKAAKKEALSRLRHEPVRRTNF